MRHPEQVRRPCRDVPHDRAQLQRSAEHDVIVDGCAAVVVGAAVVTDVTLSVLPDGQHEATERHRDLQ